MANDLFSLLNGLVTIFYLWNLKQIFMRTFTEKGEQPFLEQDVLSEPEEFLEKNVEIDIQEIADELDDLLDTLGKMKQI